MNNKFFPYIVIVLTAIAVLLLWFALKNRIMKFFNPGEQSNTATDGSGNAGSSGPAPLNTELLLKKGVYNSPEVMELQKKLGNLTVDGDFGPKTEARLKEVKCVTEIKLKDYDSTACPITESPVTNPQQPSYPWWYSLPFGYAIFG